MYKKNYYLFNIHIIIIIINIIINIYKYNFNYAVNQITTVL